MKVTSLEGHALSERTLFISRCSYGVCAIFKPLRCEQPLYSGQNGRF